MPVFLGFVVSALDRHFHSTRGLGGGLILINLDAIALERSEEIVDFFRGMHFRGERIVHFVVQQVAAFFADGNELAYRVVFFFKAYCCHKFLPQSDRERKP